MSCYGCTRDFGHEAECPTGGTYAKLDGLVPSGISAGLALSSTWKSPSSGLGMALKREMALKRDDGPAKFTLSYQNPPGLVKLLGEQSAGLGLVIGCEQNGLVFDASGMQAIEAVLEAWNLALKHGLRPAMVMMNQGMPSTLPGRLSTMNGDKIYFHWGSSFADFISAPCSGVADRYGNVIVRIRNLEEWK